MTLWILGAGASKSYLQSPINLQMPIAKDFFKTYLQIDALNNKYVLTDGIISYLADKYGYRPLNNINVDTFLNEWGEIDIEELHSEIEEKLLETPKDNPDWVIYGQTYNQLVFLFSSVINEIQNGPLSNAHQKLVSRMSSEDVIVTFNWDTLLDRALAESSSWNVDKGYGFKPKLIYKDEWLNPNCTKNNKVFPKLIKLHGSTNWITSYLIFQNGEFQLIQASSPETVYVYEKSDNPYATFKGRWLGKHAPFSYGYYPPNIPDDKGKSVGKGYQRYSFSTNIIPAMDYSSDGLTSMPLIIPPVKNKNYTLFGSLFENLWNAAEEAIEFADKIIIIGYSFPVTDSRINQSFLNAFSRRKKQPIIKIVDPINTRRVKDKMIYEFGLNEANIKCFDECFTEKFDLKVL